MKWIVIEKESEAIAWCVFMITKCLYLWMRGNPNHSVLWSTICVYTSKRWRSLFVVKVNLSCGCNEVVQTLKLYYKTHTLILIVNISRFSYHSVVDCVLVDILHSVTETFHVFEQRLRTPLNYHVYWPQQAEEPWHVVGHRSSYIYIFKFHIIWYHSDCSLTLHSVNSCIQHRKKH